MRLLVRSLVVSVASVVLAAACASPPAPTEAPVSGASRSAAPPTAVRDPIVIPTDTYARIDAPGVPVRAIPGASPDRTKQEGPLPIGLLVYVVEGPVTVDGVDWYLVASTVTPDQDQFYPSGWAPAVGEDGVPAFRSETVDCPPIPADIESVIDLRKQGVMYFEVACFGREEIGLEARLGQIDSDCWEPWGVDPEWLDCESPAPYLIPLAPDADDPLIYPAFAPGVDTGAAPHPDALGPLPIVEIKGMFDHPAAQECRNRLNYESDPEPILALTILGCRTRFVVTAMRAIGR
jgi:hypothetical protein